MKKDLKFAGYLLLYKKIEGSIMLREMITEINTYISDMDKFYIFNFCKEDQFPLIEELQKKYGEIEYAKLITLGQAADYKRVLEHAKGGDFDYVTILEKGYFYEDEAYHEIKKRLILGEIEEDYSVITPTPIYTCEDKSDKNEESRTIRGSHLTGTFINLHIYKESNGIDESYYRTTFDYDYCLQTRKKGYKVLLFNNLVLRNKNFIRLQKNILWHTFYAYHRDIYDVYYETRGRLYLWEKYKSFDPEYVKIDKKQQNLEFKEMKLFEKKFRMIKEIINEARIDYRENKTGKTYNEISY